MQNEYLGSYSIYAVLRIHFQYSLVGFEVYLKAAVKNLITKMYAVIELKYDKGKILLAKKLWLLKQQKVYNKTEDVFCYWSPDLNDSKEDIKAEYMKTFTGEPGLFKVFVLKLAGKSKAIE